MKARIKKAIEYLEKALEQEVLKPRERQIIVNIVEELREIKKGNVMIKEWTGV